MPTPYDYEDGRRGDTAKKPALIASLRLSCHLEAQDSGACQAVLRRSSGFGGLTPLEGTAPA